MRPSSAKCKAKPPGGRSGRCESLQLAEPIGRDRGLDHRDLAHRDLGRCGPREKETTKIPSVPGSPSAVQVNPDAASPSDVSECTATALTRLPKNNGATLYVPMSESRKHVCIRNDADSKSFDDLVEFVGNALKCAQKLHADEVTIVKSVVRPRLCKFHESCTLVRYDEDRGVYENTERDVCVYIHPHEDIARYLRRVVAANLVRPFRAIYKLGASARHRRTPKTVTASTPIALTSFEVQTCTEWRTSASDEHEMSHDFGTRPFESQQSTKQTVVAVLRQEFHGNYNHAEDAFLLRVALQPDDCRIFVQRL